MPVTESPKTSMPRTPASSALAYCTAPCVGRGGARIQLNNRALRLLVRNGEAVRRPFAGQATLGLAPSLRGQSAPPRKAVQFHLMRIFTHLGDLCPTGDNHQITSRSLMQAKAASAYGGIGEGHR